MNAIELMVAEHVNIRRMLKVIRSFSYDVMNNKEVDFEDMDKMIDFVRGYADKHHHGKEEIMLFNRMVEHLGSAAKKLVTNGMLVEHDMGRFHMMELERAIEKYKSGDDKARLDIIANAVGYANLLDRHIQKEDDMVYKFAERSLDADIMDIINKECIDFEQLAKENGTQEKYLDLIDEMERKYLDI